MKKSDNGGDITVSPPAARLTASTTAPTVLIQSLHQRHAIETVQVFQSEVKLVHGSNLAGFLLHYFCCEALAKLLDGASTGKTPVKALMGKVDVGRLRTSLSRFSIQFDDAALDRIFRITKVGVAKKSARELRNLIVHRLHADSVTEVRKRKVQLINDMRQFINTIETATMESLRF